MIVLLAIILYAVFVLGGIQFFRQVHRWDEQASKMWNEELLRLESEKTRQIKARRNKAGLRIEDSSPGGRVPKLAPTTVSLEN